MFGSGVPQSCRSSEERTLRHLQAEQRSEMLLRHWLSPEQVEQFEAHRYFDVIGSDTATRYRIHHGTVMNILEFAHDGRVAQRLCFAPSSIVPIGDVMLAQKIALEKFELATLAIANKDGTQRGTELVLVSGLGLMFALTVVLMWLFLYNVKIGF